MLRHTAAPLALLEDDASEGWVEGEPGDEGPRPIAAPAFPCFLFLPNVNEADAAELSWRPGRAITRPSVMWNLADVVGDQPKQGVELLITADDLAAFTGGSPARWIVDGLPQPFGPPGRAFGALATLRQVVGP